MQKREWGWVKNWNKKVDIQMAFKIQIGKWFSNTQIRKHFCSPFVTWIHNHKNEKEKNLFGGSVKFVFDIYTRHLSGDLNRFQIDLIFASRKNSGVKYELNQISLNSNMECFKLQTKGTVSFCRWIVDAKCKTSDFQFCIHIQNANMKIAKRIGKCDWKWQYLFVGIVCC